MHKELTTPSGESWTILPALVSAVPSEAGSVTPSVATAVMLAEAVVGLDASAGRSVAAATESRNILASAVRSEGARMTRQVPGLRREFVCGVEAGRTATARRTRRLEPSSRRRPSKIVSGTTDSPAGQSRRGHGRRRRHSPCRHRRRASTHGLAVTPKRLSPVMVDGGATTVGQAVASPRSSMAERPGTCRSRAFSRRRRAGWTSQREAKATPRVASALVPEASTVAIGEAVAGLVHGIVPDEVRRRPTEVRNGAPGAARSASAAMTRQVPGTSPGVRWRH